MALVALFQYWEDFHRSNIAVYLGKQKNDLNIPIMGDIRQLRISIIHHAGVALKEVDRCEVLKWYREGDDIFVDQNKFEEIVFHVKSMLEDLRKYLAAPGEPR
jgi:hypothetical protein